MKKILIFLLLCTGIGINSSLAQTKYDVKKVCYGTGITAMVVEYNSQFYVITSQNVPLTTNTVIVNIPNISFGGQSEIRLSQNAGDIQSGFVNVVKSGQSVFVNNRWQRYMFSGFPGAQSVCREIANGY